MSLVRFPKLTRQAKHDFPAASIYVKQNRIMFNTAAFNAFQKLSKGAPVDYVQVYLDSENSKVFYVVPAEENAPDARKLGKTSKTGRFLDGKRLLTTLNWNITEPVTLKMEINKKGNMFRVSREAVV